MTRAQYQIDAEQDEDCEPREASAARRIGFTVAAIAWLAAAVPGLYVWIIDLDQTTWSAWEHEVIRVLKDVGSLSPLGYWAAYFLFAFLVAALLPSLLLSFARHNSPTHFQSEHWIWSTLLFWVCGIWVLHLPRLVQPESLPLFFPQSWRSFGFGPSHTTTAAWLSVALLTAGSAFVASYRARAFHRRSPVDAVRRARAARLRLTLGIAPVYFWVHCMVYAAAIQADYLSSYAHIRACLGPATFALVLYAMLRVARNRCSLRPTDAWSATAACISAWTLAYTYHVGTGDVLGVDANFGSKKPTIFEPRISNTTLAVAIPLLALLGLIAWRDWRSATGQLLELRRKA